MYTNLSCRKDNSDKSMKTYYVIIDSLRGKIVPSLYRNKNDCQAGVEKLIAVLNDCGVDFNFEIYEIKTSIPKFILKILIEICG